MDNSNGLGEQGKEGKEGYVLLCCAVCCVALSARLFVQFDTLHVFFPSPSFFLDDLCQGCVLYHQSFHSVRFRRSLTCVGRHVHSIALALAGTAPKR